MLLFILFNKSLKKININSHYINVLFDVNNVVLLMFISLIKLPNKAFYLILIRL